MSRICTFFGHRDAPEEIQPMLEKAVLEMIHYHHVDTFYVGCEGRFDAMAQRTLDTLRSKYPEIISFIVLSRYKPDMADVFTCRLSTILPEGAEFYPPRFAVSRRNRWMLGQAECVITYIRHSWGGAAQFAAQAERQNKTIIRL